MRRVRLALFASPSHIVQHHSTGAVHVIDFYLDEARDHERHQIINLVHREDEKCQKLLLGYVREAMREQSHISHVDNVLM